MTAKEKAKELVDKHFYTLKYGLKFDILIKLAKKCALIAVEELIEETAELYQEMGSIIFNKDIDDSTILDKLNEREEYWGEVGDEIKKL
jgi:chaperonin cofactor prefoldin